MKRYLFIAMVVCVGCSDPYPMACPEYEMNDWVMISGNPRPMQVQTSCIWSDGVRRYRLRPAWSDYQWSHELSDVPASDIVEKLDIDPECKPVKEDEK